MAEEHGLYYRADVDVAEYQERLLGDDAATIEDYQYWVDDAWKEKHGTPDAALRFGDKIIEEHKEFREAIETHRDQATNNSIEHTVEEAGDLLWCATALASACTANIDNALKESLFAYCHGVSHIYGQTIYAPSWQPTAGRLAVMRNPITIHDIDTLIDDGFEPLPSPAMFVDEGEDDGSTNDHLLQVFFLTEAIRQQSANIYALDDTQPEMLLPGTLQARGQVVGTLTGHLFLEVSFLLQRTTGSSLTDIIRSNVAKISERVTKGTVDKSDGPRT